MLQFIEEEATANKKRKSGQLTKQEAVWRRGLQKSRERMEIDEQFMDSEPQIMLQFVGEEALETLQIKWRNEKMGGIEYR